jgi:hypothetical protein
MLIGCRFGGSEVRERAQDLGKILHRVSPSPPSIRDKQGAMAARVLTRERLVGCKSGLCDGL